MNTFYEHHKESIWFQYACFHRILLNGTIPLLLEPTAALGFFSLSFAKNPIRLR